MCIRDRPCAEPGQRRPPREGEYGVNGKQLPEYGGQRLHHARAGGHAQQRPSQAKSQRLQQKNAQQVRRTRAHRLENGEHVHAPVSYTHLDVYKRQVVHCAARGKTNKAIASELCLSEHTVKNYLFKAFEKLGVSSRVELLFYLCLLYTSDVYKRQDNHVELQFEASRVLFDGDGLGESPQDQRSNSASCLKSEFLSLPK